MVSYICKSCGFTTSEQNVKYCQTCGSPLVAQDGETCPKCNGPIAAGAKFCSMCGTQVGKDSPPVTVKSQQQPQANVTSTSREVTGPILKLMPIAHYLDNAVRLVGAIQLRRDGLRFNALNGERIVCHVDDVEQLSQGNKKDINK